MYHPECPTTMQNNRPWVPPVAAERMLLPNLLALTVTNSPLAPSTPATVGLVDSAG